MSIFTRTNPLDSKLISQRRCAQININVEERVFRMSSLSLQKFWDVSIPAFSEIEKNLSCMDGY
jgi:hypothetical protein